MKYLIYARISPRGSDYDHSAENSTEMQIEYCTTYINNLAGENTVVGIVKDEFASGGDLKRPEMKKIIDDVQHDRAAWDCICVYNLSRLTRSASDLNLIMELLSSHHKTFVSAREPEFDFNNPLGEMVMGVITYVNQYMRKISASTTKDKMMQLARRGEWPCGNPPFGYKRGPAKDNRLYLDPVKSVIVRDVFEMYASELYTTRDIIVKYKLSLSKSQIMKILRNQTYLGKISYDGYLFDGKHDRIVDDNLFQRVQDKLPRIKEAIRPKAYKYPFLLSGLLFCHCGKHLTPGTAKSGAYAYYTCTDPLCRMRISAPKVEDAATAHIVTQMKTIPRDMLDAALEELRKEERIVRERNEPELKQLILTQKKLESENKKLLNLLLKSDELDASFILELNAKKRENLRNLSTLDARIKALTAPSCSDSAFYQLALSMVQTLGELSELFSQTSDRSRLRTILPLYFLGIHLQKDGSFVFDLKPPIGSTKCTEWWAIMNFLVPRYFTFRVA